MRAMMANRLSVKPAALCQSTVGAVDTLYGAVEQTVGNTLKCKVKRNFGVEDD